MEKNARHVSRLQEVCSREGEVRIRYLRLFSCAEARVTVVIRDGRRIERGVRAGPGQVQGYTPDGNNERNQCCTTPLGRQSNGRRVRATTPLASIAFCRPLVSATATTEAGRGKSCKEREGEGHRKYRDGTEAMNPLEKRGRMLREGM